MTAAEIAGLFQGATLHGDVYAARCPVHDDRRSSLSVGTGKKDQVLIHCHVGCALDDVLAAVGLTLKDLRNGNGHAASRSIGATYDYHDADGRLSYQVVRWNPKGFSQRRPDGSGGWIGNVKDTPRVLYRLRELRDADPSDPVFVVEGEKDADRLAALGLIATTNAGGAGKWRPEYSDTLRGRNVVVLPDHDEPGGAHGRLVADALRGIAASVKIVVLFDGPPPKKHGRDVSDWLDAGHSVDELRELAAATAAWQPAERPAIVQVSAAEPPAVPVPLDSVIGTFRKWLHLPDPDPLCAMFAAVVANRRPGDPVWMMAVGSSSRGKSEQLGSLSRLPDVHPAATITEASLLSGTAKRERSPDAKGGLLRHIGEYGIIVCKDFGSILNMSRDPRAATLAALREIYDGSWVRHVGTDGGRTLQWTGKVGFVGGCTPTIDRHHAVMASMGERFVFVRLPDQDDSEMARRALKHAGHEAAMRAELAAAVAGLFAGLKLDQAAPELTDAETDRLIAMTTLTVRCRSSVERDAYSREIELIAGAESPGRLTRVAANLLAALHVIGLPQHAAWRILNRIVLDSMPQLRRKVLVTLAASKAPMTSVQVAETCGYPTGTARRQLEELAAYDVVARAAQGQGKRDLWSLTDWTIAQLQAAGTFPEMSVGVYSEADDEGGQPPLIQPVTTLTDKTGKVASTSTPSTPDGMQQEADW
jgi:hypothetical protein